MSKYIYKSKKDGKLNQRIYFALIGLIIIGFLLRLYKLSAQSIWLDEAFSIYHSQQPLTHVLALKDPNPPLYYTLLHFFIKFFGISEFSVRLLSVLTGTASIYLIFLLGSLMFNNKAGIYSALIFTLSPLHIYYSQEARAYSLLFLLTLSSMYFYLKLYNSLNKRNIALYLISSILLVYTHMYGLLIILIQNAYFIFTNIKNYGKLKQWCILQLIIFLFFIPWIFALFEVVSLNAHSWIPKPKFMDLTAIPYIFLAGESYSVFGSILTTILLILILYFLSAVKRGMSAFFGIWIIFPIILPFFFSIFFTPIFSLKYVLISSLPLFLIIGSSFLNMNKIIRASFLLVIVILSITALYAQQSIVNKDPWIDATNYIRANFKNGDTIIIIEDYESLPFIYYFQRNCFISDDFYQCIKKNDIYPESEFGSLTKFQNKNIWLILSRIQYGKNKDISPDYIENNFDVLIFKEFKLKQNSRMFNKLYELLKKNKLISDELNSVRVYHISTYKMETANKNL